MLDSLFPEEYRKKFGSPKISPSSVKKKKGQILSENAGKDFLSSLQEKGEESFQMEINHFLDDLEGLEKQLLDNPSEQTVYQYRKSIGEFLKKISKNYASFEFMSRRRRQCKIWRVIDSELDIIYRGIVARQLKGILLLDRLQSVKGLIIDLQIGKKG